MLYYALLGFSFIGGIFSLRFRQADTNVSNPLQIGMPTNQTEGQQPMNSTIGGVYICHDINWMNCTYAVFPLNTCFDMNQAWNNSISSIGPDKGTLVMFFSHPNCTGNSTDITFPGRSNLIQMGGMNDQISSINVLPAPMNASGYAA